MADGSKIEWTDATWNPITGCSVVSPGCTNCYAMRLAGTRLRNHPSREGLTIDSKAGPVWNGQVRFNEQWLDQPLRWTRPRMIFVCAHGDLFHENVPDEWIERVFGVMNSVDRHVYQVLTKRTDRLWHYLRHHTDQRPKSHIWLGFSAEDQERFDERWPHMEKLAWAGWLTWLSAEPLLGPIDITPALWPFRPCGDCPSPDPDKGIHDDCCRDPELVDGLKWVVAGGESGPGARPAHPDWFRTLRDDCVNAKAPFHFKQHGDWLPGEVYAKGQSGGFARHQDGTEGNHASKKDHWWSGGCFGGVISTKVGKKAAGRLLDGRTWDEMPATLRALEEQS